MINFPANNPPAESYLNTRANPPCENLRWWVAEKTLMGGGSIVSADDWAHLRDDFGITHVLNLDSKSHVEFVPSDRLCEVSVLDNGMAIAAPLLKACCEFAKAATFDPSEPVFKRTGIVYVCSGNGGARAPAIIYAILRTVYLMDHEEALAEVNKGFPHSDGYHFGYLDGHRCAVGSVDLWIDEGGLGA